MGSTKPRIPGNWENLPHGLGRLRPRVSKPAMLNQGLVPKTTADVDASNPYATSNDPSYGTKTSLYTPLGNPSEGLSSKQPPTISSSQVVVVPIKTESNRIAVKVEHTRKDVKNSGHENPTDIAHVLGQSNIDSEDMLKAAIGTISKVSKTKKSATTPNALRKPKHPYGLDYKNSPFPHLSLPNPEACEEVHRLLVEEHGAVIQPAIVPPPSREVTGCGEVPDLLDAVLRTHMSSATSSGNSNRALAGLIAAFPNADGEDTVIDWNAVRRADVKSLYDAIKSGGLANKKATNIKMILDIVFQQNINRRDALIKEEKTGIPAELDGIEGLTREQKAAEVSRIAKNPLTLDWIFELKDTSQVMDELIKLPSIGVKTASCAILFNMRRPSFAVDTHVWRHCKYLGWVPVTASANQTFNHCDLRIPDHLKYALHQLFICHGKNCHRCRGNTSAGTSEWNNSVCILEHLVTRMERRKQPGYKASAKDAKDAKREGPSEVEGRSNIPNKKKKAVSGATGRKRKPTENNDDSSDVKVVLTKRVKRGAKARKVKGEQDDEDDSDYETSQKKPAKRTHDRGKKAFK